MKFSWLYIIALIIAVLNSSIGCYYLSYIENLSDLSLDNRGSDN